MRQFWYGLSLFLLLALPPVRGLLESIMAFHMHMQMMLLVVSGLLMAPFFQKHFGGIIEKFNKTGIPGTALFFIILLYWMLPRTMDEALELWTLELFKFISLPFLAGVPLRDSWKKLGRAGQIIGYLVLSVIFSTMAYLYIFSESTLCNNYLMTDQKTVGWGFAFFAVCILLYLILTVFTDQSQYFESEEE
ncbi:hypothetical protein [Salinicoccus sp. HZC-1]|uniref:hypothetical protein n=1 Tax=Salinicoccus sp. HZC-1 TaxID=3385497 RepID=UPI00398A8358